MFNIRASYICLSLVILYNDELTDWTFLKQKKRGGLLHPPVPQKIQELQELLQELQDLQELQEIYRSYRKFSEITGCGFPDVFLQWL